MVPPTRSAFGGHKKLLGSSLNQEHLNLLNSKEHAGEVKILQTHNS